MALGKIIIGAICGLFMGLVLMRQFGLFGLIFSVIFFTIFAIIDFKKAALCGIIGVVVLVVIIFAKVLLGI